MPGRTRLTQSSIDARAGAVLLVANYESDVGYAWWLMENFWNLIARAAAAAGRRTVLAYPKINTIPEIIGNAPIDTVERSFKIRTVDEVLASLRLIRQYGVRSIYLTDWPALHWAYAFWRLAGVKHIVIHDHTPGDRPPIGGIRGMIKRALQNLGIFSAHTNIAVSPYIGQRLTNNSCIPARRCRVVTNGIRIFDHTGNKRAAIRNELGIPSDAILVVLVSRITRYKGVDFAIRALAQLQNDSALRGRVYAVHCGDGPDRQEFEQLARSLRVDSHFRFLGRRNDVHDILCAADIAFHPSNGEAMSLAVLEFMCAKLAVLTSDLPSVSTAIEPDATGLVYKHGDINAAAAQLLKLVNDAALRTQLGEAGRAACRDRYSIDAMNAAFIAAVIPEL